MYSTLSPSKSPRKAETETNRSKKKLNRLDTANSALRHALRAHRSPLEKSLSHSALTRLFSARSPISCRGGELQKKGGERSGMSGGVGFSSPLDDLLVSGGTANHSINFSESCAARYIHSPFFARKLPGHPVAWNTRSRKARLFSFVLLLSD